MLKSPNGLTLIKERARKKRGQKNEIRKGGREREEQRRKIKRKKICLTLHNLCFPTLLDNKIISPKPHRICYHCMAWCEVLRNTLRKILHHINIIFLYICSKINNVLYRFYCKERVHT